MPGTSALDSARRALDTARDQYRGFSRTTRTLVIVGAVSVLLLGILEGWTAAEAYDKETARLLDNMDRARNARSQLRPAFRDGDHAAISEPVALRRTPADQQTAQCSCNLI